MEKNFWIPKLIENGYKKANFSAFGTTALGISGTSLYLDITLFDGPVSWFSKYPFIIGALSKNSILYFILTLNYDPVKKSNLIEDTEIIISSATKITVGGLVLITRIEKAEEIQRLIEAIPNDLALCLDIVWAKPLIETYFKKI